MIRNRKKKKKLCFWASVFILRETLRGQRDCFWSCVNTCRAQQVREDGSGAQGPLVRSRGETATQEAVLPATQHVAGPSSGLPRSPTSSVPECLSPRQACSRSLAGAWSFCHRIRFPCGIFVSTFYSFKKTDNTGRERHLEPRTRIEFLMKIATLQEPLFPIVFHASHTQTTSQTWRGMDYVVSELEPMQILDYRLTDRILHQLWFLKLYYFYSTCKCIDKVT